MATPPASSSQQERSLYRDPRIWCLAVAETLVWAASFYLFPALLLSWEADFGWSKPDLTLAITLALLVTAAAAPRVGAWIDRGHGGLVLTMGALLIGALLIALTFVETQAGFILVWIGLGLAMSACLYEPCFAFLTHQRGVAAPRAITLITLVAGFAGTVSFPLAIGIAEAAGWRSAAFVFAGLAILFAAPLFWIGSRPRLTDSTMPPASVDAGTRGPLAAALRGPVFWLLGISIAAMALNHGMVVTHLLPLLDSRGVPEALAVLAISLIGPMQVAGRLAMIAVERYIGMIAIAAATSVMMILSGILLGLAATLPLLIYLFVALQGSAAGVNSITKPVVTALLLGRRGFGAISGALGLGFMTANALAPSLGSMLWAWGGYDRLIQALITLGLVAFLCFIAAVRLARRATPTGI